MSRGDSRLRLLQSNDLLSTPTSESPSQSPEPDELNRDRIAGRHSDGRESAGYDVAAFSNVSDFGNLSTASGRASEQDRKGMEEYGGSSDAADTPSHGTNTDHTYSRDALDRPSAPASATYMESPATKRMQHNASRHRSVLSLRAMDDEDPTVPDVTAQNVVEKISKFRTGERKHVYDPVLDSEVEAQQGLRDDGDARTRRAPPGDDRTESILHAKKYTILTDGRAFHEFADLSELMGDRGMQVIRNTHGTFWLDVFQPDAADMEFMEQVFGMHPLTVEDILTDGTREKMEIYERYIFFNVQSLASSESTYDIGNMVESMFIAVYVNFVLTFHVRPSQRMPRVVRRVRAAKTLRPDWVMYTLLDEIVDSCVPLVEIAEAEVESINDLVLLLSGSEQSDTLRRIGNARKRLSDLHRRLHPKREMLAAMTTRAHKCLSPSTQLYLRDVLDHVLGMLMQIEMSRETLNTSQSNYLAKVSIELANYSNDMSKVMKTLTIAATILMPLTLISGVFGMNVYVPGQIEENSDSLGPFFGVVGSMAGIAATLLFLFLRAGYI